MAKAKPSTRDTALEALSALAADPAPRVLFGTSKLPGVFSGSSAPVKAAAALCEKEGWIEPTGARHGTGKSAKPLYQLSAAGLRSVVDNVPETRLLKDMLTALDHSSTQLETLRTNLERTAQMVGQQTGVVREMLGRVEPKDFEGMVRRVLDGLQNAQTTSSAPAVPPPTVWPDEALKYLAAFRAQNPYGRCPLPELFERVAAPRKLSIGQFHDGIRRLVEAGKVRWHPFTGPAFRLEQDQYAIVAGQEIKYYVEFAG